ncbi:dihydrolipoyllysine-residue acetyltransferase [Eoetvoesiella caeni]
MSTIEIKVPDIGDFKEVEVIEVLVGPGDSIKVDQSLITVESDKASMEIPASHAGVLKELKVQVGDKIAEGSLLAIVAVQSEQRAIEPTAHSASPMQAFVSEPAAISEHAQASAWADVAGRRTDGETEQSKVEPAVAAAIPAPASAAIATAVQASSAPSALTGGIAHGSPSVRKYARELGVDLARLAGTGPKGRIQRSDVQSYIKSAVADSSASSAGSVLAGGTGLNILPWPSLDFSKFGSTELQPLSRIKKISGPNLHRNWVMIPHITQYDEADVTELEEFRKSVNAATGSGAKLTLLAFAIKASVAALKKFPAFNSSLDSTGQNLILKQYYNIGFAADTPNGLVVPVIKEADKKGVSQVALEMAELSAQAREGKLKPADMQGASFTISSLGGIGGLGFTPIINAPEVAILGLSKTRFQPVWDGAQFVPRLMMPMSLSYDHRVVDGALGARFSVYLSSALTDLRRVLL